MQGRLLFGVGATLLVQVVNGCFTLTGVGVYPSGSGGTLGLRDNGNMWKPPHEGCNILACGTRGSTEASHTNRLVLNFDDLKGDNCTTTEDCGPDKMCAVVNGYGHCSHALVIKGIINSIPHSTDLGDGEEHNHEPEDGELIFSIKYGEDPKFFDTPGVQLSPGSRKFSKDDPRPEEFSVVEAMLDPLYSPYATVQVEHKTIVPDTQEVVHYYQCIDLEINNAPLHTFNETRKQGTGAPNPNEGAPPDDGSSSTTPEGLTTFQIVLIILSLLIIIIVCIICIVQWRRNKNLEKMQEKDAIFEPVVQEDVLPPVVLTKEEESMKESLSSDLSKRLESDENVAHIGYGEEDYSDQATPTPDPSGGTGSKGRHFHFRYVEEDATEV